MRVKKIINRLRVDGHRSVLRIPKRINKLIVYGIIQVISFIAYHKSSFRIFVKNNLIVVYMYFAAKSKSALKAIGNLASIVRLFAHEKHAMAADTYINAIKKIKDIKFIWSSAASAHIFYLISIYANSKTTFKSYIGSSLIKVYSMISGLTKSTQKSLASVSKTVRLKLTESHSFVSKAVTSMRVWLSGIGKNTFDGFGIISKRMAVSGLGKSSFFSLCNDSLIYIGNVLSAMCRYSFVAVADISSKIRLSVQAKISLVSTSLLSLVKILTPSNVKVSFIGLAHSYLMKFIRGKSAFITTSDVDVTMRIYRKIGDFAGKTIGEIYDECRTVGETIYIEK